MKKLLTPLALAIWPLGGLQAEVVIGGSATQDVGNWVTSSVAFGDTVQSGYSLNWENLLTNEVAVDPVDQKFELTWEAGEDHTIGHLFMYDEGVDLATLANGIERFYWVADFEASAFANWSPVISVTTGGETRYYRWNHSGNDWSGNGGLNFSAPFDGDDPYRFDLSQLGNGTNAATGIWGELNGSATNFAETRDNPIGPDLQAAEGEVAFGFLQWTSSSSQALAETTFTTAIDCFEVILNADSGQPPVVETRPASEVTAISALVTGELTTFGTDFSNLTFYWGESDGGTDPTAWDNSEALGVEACLFSVELSGLSRGTSYFYRFFAENSAGSDWSDAPETFTTGLATEPVVIVTPGTSTQPGVASFTGEVTDTGNEDPVITVFYGLSDGGTNPAAWDFVTDLGQQGGIFAAEVRDLDGGVDYFYRAFAENSAGAAWAPESASVAVTPFRGVSGELNSSDFDFQYEMDDNPGLQDLDAGGSANDWFAAPAQATGVDREMWIPQDYSGGLALSDQDAGIPEALFRSDFTGSISRQSLTGSFTVEVALRLLPDTILSPGFDLGGFGIFVNPPGQSALRVNINEDAMSLGEGENPVATGSNTDRLHLFRVAYVAEDQRYLVWRDGRLVFGGSSGVAATNDSIFAGGGLFLGDFAVDLSGDWEVDYIRLHDEAVAPTGEVGDFRVLDSGFMDPDTYFIDFQGIPNTRYRVMSSDDLLAFDTEEPFTGANGTTNDSGIGRFEVDVTGRVPGRIFFRLEQDE